MPAVFFLLILLKGMRLYRPIPPLPMRCSIQTVLLSCPASLLQPANVVGMRGAVDLQKLAHATFHTHAYH